MKIKPLKHVRLHQMKFFWWDPKDDPREPEYWDSLNGGPFFVYIFCKDILIALFCKVKKTIKEYREIQMKMYTRIADRLEQRLAAVNAAKGKLEEQIDRDTEVIED